VTLQGAAALENAAGTLPGQGSLSIQGLAFGQSLLTLSAPGASPDGSVTVTYTYDALNRLSAADYSNGDYFHYTFDAVGNRLSQESSLGGTQVSTEYTYDDANRLTGAGGVSYTWDNNGNLLSDGTNTYTYDGANRLVEVVTGSSTVTYAYDGMGNRLQQSENGVTTTYTLDLAGPLSQVLSDGTNTYLYGNGRIAQENAQGRQYFLGDSLGSVRQLVDENGLVTLAKRYDPYGNVIQSVGEGESAFGFTGEGTGQGLIYLHSRYYSTATGRFITEDSWDGDNKTPMSYNDWLYVYSNPINLRDPSGKSPHYCDYLLPQQRAKISDCSSENNFTPEGLKAFQVYQLYERSTGFWNNWTTEFISPETFLGLMTFYEIGGAYSVTQAIDLATEASARTLWTGDLDPNRAKCDGIPCYDSSTNPPTIERRRGHCNWNPPYCTGDYCFAGVFNYLGRQVSTVHSRFTWVDLGWKEIKDASAWGWPRYFGFLTRDENSINGKKEKVRQGMDYVKQVGNDIWHPKDPSWKIFDPNRPISWGNGAMWTNKPNAESMFMATGSYQCNINKVSAPNYLGAVCASGEWSLSDPNAAWMLVTPGQRNKLN
jgi:RHS repeat-associated protein